MKRLNLIIGLLFFVCTASNAQEDDIPNLQNGNLSQQFDYISEKSNNYQDFKVVKKAWLNTLKENTLDSISKIKTELFNSNAVITTKDKKIEDLENELTQINSTLEQKINEKDYVSFFGIMLSKSAYSIIIWSFITILLVLLAGVLLKFKTNQATTNQAIEALDRVEKEYEEHRKIALEREQKVRRQLQDELNKQKK